MIDHVKNLLTVLVPCIAGVVHVEMETIHNLFSLPNSKHYKKTIFPLLTNSMQKDHHGFGKRDEIFDGGRYQRNHHCRQGGGEHYDCCIKKLVGEREQIGLVVVKE